MGRATVNSGCGQPVETVCVQASIVPFEGPQGITLIAPLTNIDDIARKLILSCRHQPRSLHGMTTRKGAPKTRATGNRTVAILGMHRSGTSALAGSLEQAGLYLGATCHKSSDNFRGNRESTAIMILHNDLLARSGGSWDKPVRKLTWEPVHRALLSTIIETYSDQPLWGFKDPRTLFTTNMWRKQLPALEMVGIFRHPYLVADSLIRRDGMSEEQALELWFIYNKNLQWLALNQGPLPIVEFSTDAEGFNFQLNQLIRILKLESRQVDFFDEKLRKQTIPELKQSKIANRCLNLYSALQALSLLHKNNRSDGHCIRPAA